MISLEGIQRAAVRTFSERGYAATGIRDIAAEAGVTSGALYLHASSKMAILESVMHFALDELLRTAVVATDGDRAAAYKLEGLVRAHVSSQGTNPRTAQIVDGEVRSLSELPRRAIVAKRDAYERYWSDVLAQGVADGDFAVDDLSITRLAVLEMCNGVAHWYQPGGPLDLPRIEEIFVRLAFNLVRYPGPDHGPRPELRARRLPCEPA
ncbi:TetR/AcrR family transcriptional regulator [Pseudonocardia acaciae]|uniref:TetR/AcrR family transcriptional regulator n=1 Tax=Pseudonocardia acaciae TaxID=551276 RepID=UPI0006846C8F|nr:TetR/AcrR family transcriptional regulator [Pseudonocardia acaciae]